MSVDQKYVYIIIAGGDEPASPIATLDRSKIIPLYRKEYQLTEICPTDKTLREFLEKPDAELVGEWGNRLGRGWGAPELHVVPLK